MPRGIAKIEKIAAEKKARSDAYNAGEGFQRGLYLKNNESARGRFCEEGAGIWYVITHDLPKKPGQQYADRILCLDQAFSDAEEANYVDGSKECYACTVEGVRRGERVVMNFIRYDEPKLVRDKDNKPVQDAQGNYQTNGIEPTLVVASFATGVGGQISYLESQYGPISKHVCSIYKTGDKQNPYRIDVVERDKPAEPWEQQMWEKRPLPPKAITALSPKFLSIPLMNNGTMRQIYGGVGVPSGFSNSTSGDGQPMQENTYAQAAQGHINLGAFGS